MNVLYDVIRRIEKAVLNTIHKKLGKIYRTDFEC